MEALISKPKIVVKPRPTKSLAKIMAETRDKAFRPADSEVADPETPHETSSAEELISEVITTILSETKKEKKNYYEELTPEQQAEWEELQTRAKALGYHLVKTRVGKVRIDKPKSKFTVETDEGKEYIRPYCVRNMESELETMPDKHFPKTVCRKYFQQRDMLYDSIPLLEFIEMVNNFTKDLGKPRDITDYFTGRTIGKWEINTENGEAIDLAHKGAIPREDAPLPPNPRIYIPAFIPLLKELIENDWTCSEYAENLRKDTTPRTAVLNKSWETFLDIFEREERRETNALKVACLSLIILHVPKWAEETYEDVKTFFLVKSMSHTLMFGLQQSFSPFKRLNLVGITGRKKATVAKDELGDL
jgi:hypothetical protein